MRSSFSVLFVLSACVVSARSAHGAARPREPGTRAAGDAYSASAGEAPAALPAVFRGDTRLQAKITTALVDRPLGEALALLGRETGVPLRARPETADDKVTLFVDERPAADVLALLAGQFQLRWRRSFRGYELGRDSADVAHEAALRRADEAAEWARLRAWVERLDGLLRTPREQPQARSTAAAARLKEASLAADERSRLSMEAAALQDALRRETPPSVALLRSLTAAQVERLLSDGSLLLSAADASLAPRLLAQVPKPPAENPADSPPEDPRTRPVSADAHVTLMRAGRGGTAPYTGERALNVDFFVGLERNANRRWEWVSWSPLIPAKERETAPTVVTDEPALTRPVELRLPPRPAHSASRKGDRAPSHASGPWPDWPTLGEVLEALHQVTGLEVLADSFVRERVDPRWIAARQPVARLLDRLARELDCTWRKEGSTLVLCSRAADWDRALEVPERLVRPWQQRFAPPGAPSLDSLAELAAVLNDDQSFGLGLYWGWYLEGVPPGPTGGDEFYVQRRHLRFWAALSPAQRQQALAGATVPVEQMSGAQREAFVTALMDPLIEPYEPGAALVLSGRSPSPAELLTGSFSVKSVEWRVQSFVGVKPTGETTEISALHPASRPPILSNLPPGFQWSAVGTPTALDRFTFAYSLSGEQQPSRTVELGALRPSSPPHPTDAK